MSSSDRPRPPSVERVLAAARAKLDIPRDPIALTAAAREIVDEERDRLAAGAAPATGAAAGTGPIAASADVLADRLIARLDAWAGHDPVWVINATGVIVHTNLGRAPWSEHAAEAIDEATDYLLLEIDRETGRRGRRLRLAEEHLIALTGAEDALVTNNNAAALALAVGLVGRGRGVAVSRGELVEIGGGVRIPDIIRRAGARLIEVGTTNRTRVADFEEALADGRASAVLRVHPSNFTVSGFTEAPDPAAVADIAHRHSAIVIDDLGSGALLDTAAYGLAHEPLPGERLRAGSDLVMFSGDKLVGGPQAGLVVGRADLIERMRRDPLARAMRPDKVTMLGVAKTLGLYRAGLAADQIPVWVMISAAIDGLRTRAETLATRLGDAVEAIEVRSTVGGGSLPGETLPSWGLALRVPSAERTLAALRLPTPIVVARVADGQVILDLRTVDPDADDALAGAIERALPEPARLARPERR